jgi:small subunit ribosomal protein S5e
MAESQSGEAKLFGKWSYAEVNVEDLCFKDYIAIKEKAQVFLPHTAGRYQVKRFRKVQCPIVERLVGSLQYHGRNTGKKSKAIRIVRHTLEIIHLLTGKNPLEVLIGAIVNSGAREDSTRIGSGGTVRKQAVDVSPMRRVNQAIYLITVGARDHSFRSFKSIAECLADEIINAEQNNAQGSFAIKKKEEIEKVAKGNR